jgi:hypothetical protein
MMTFVTWFLMGKAWGKGVGKISNRKPKFDYHLILNSLFWERGAFIALRKNKG